MAISAQPCANLLSNAAGRPVPGMPAYFAANFLFGFSSGALRKSSASAWTKAGSPAFGCQPGNLGGSRLGDSMGDSIYGTAAGSVPSGSRFRTPGECCADPAGDAGTAAGSVPAGGSATLSRYLLEVGAPFLPALCFVPIALAASKPRMASRTARSLNPVARATEAMLGQAQSSSSAWSASRSSTSFWVGERSGTDQAQLCAFKLIPYPPPLPAAWARSDRESTTG
jgi:hypothetical protein